MFSLMLFFFRFFFNWVEVGHIGVEENGGQKFCALFLVLFVVCCFLWFGYYYNKGPLL